MLRLLECLILLLIVVGSPSGKLVQIEHALTAVGLGQTSLGIKGDYEFVHVIIGFF